MKENETEQYEYDDFDEGNFREAAPYDPEYDNRRQFFEERDITNAPNDKKSVGFCILGFFIPLAGLICYFVRKGEHPIEAKHTLKFSLIGFIVGLVIFIATVGLMIFGMVEIGKQTISTMEDIGEGFVEAAQDYDFDFDEHYIVENVDNIQVPELEQEEPSFYSGGFIYDESIFLGSEFYENEITTLDRQRNLTVKFTFDNEIIPVYLISPSGQIIGPDSFGMSYYEEDEIALSSVYVIRDAEAGTWKAKHNFGSNNFIDFVTD